MKTYKSASGLIVTEMSWEEYQIKKHKMKDILELTEKVKKMREAQKEYDRTYSSIAKSKKESTEKEVDHLVKEIGLPSRSSQPTMF